VKYAFIHQNGVDLPVRRQCRLLGVSSSGYYGWLRRKDRPGVRHERQSVIDRSVQQAFERRRARYGSPRLTLDLVESGFRVAENTVAASMRRLQLVAKAGRKFKATTNSRHALPVAANLLGQDFGCDRANQKWCGDITYLWTDQGWLYLAVVLDLFSRRVIGWSMDSRMTRQLVCDAMGMAITARGQVDGTIMHTDRGSQYCSHQCQRLLSKHGLRASMSGRGNCYDNACAESFFHSLKVEAIHGETRPTHAAMRERVFEYIETDYNVRRHHTANGKLSPAAFELKYAA